MSPCPAESGADIAKNGPATQRSEYTRFCWILSAQTANRRSNRGQYRRWGPPPAQVSD